MSKCLAEVLKRKVKMLAKFAVLLLLLAFGAIQASADSVFEIVGTLTIPGNSSNPGVSETINYSFEFDPSLPTTVIGTPTITGFGPLGQHFTFAENGAFLAGPPSSYFGFFSPGVEIDLLTNAPDSTIITGSWLWSCDMPLPCAEFYPGKGAPLNASGNGSGLIWPGTANASVHLVPEPGTFFLSVLGVFALCLMIKTLRH